MRPVRHYSAPYQGLDVQLAELKGLVRIFPPLIEADRNRRWNEIGERDGEPEEEMIDIYASEAGSEEGWGHADFARTLYSTAIVTAWETFNVHLVRQLFEVCLLRPRSGQRPRCWRAMVCRCNAASTQSHDGKVACGCHRGPQRRADGDRGS